MAKCENCYHYEACLYFLSKENKVLNNTEGFVCEHYKDKSLIVELPCRVGDTVYILIDESEKFGGSYIKEEKVAEISTAGRIWTNDCYYDSDDVGKTIFLSREEAERALESLEESEKNEV